MTSLPSRESIADIAAATDLPTSFVDKLLADLAPCLRLVPSTEVQAELPPHASFFRGTPFLPEGYSWPHDDEGRPLTPLLQINFGDLPAFKGYPTAGLLQLFIGSGDMFGATTSGEACEVRFLPDVPASDRPAPAAAAIDLPAFTAGTTYTPFFRFFDAPADALTHPLPVIGQLAWSIAGDPMDRLHEDHGDDPAISDLEETLVEFLDSTDGLASEPLHQLGGHPYFIQEPHSYDGLHHFLQVDSDYQAAEVAWGDDGVAHLFLSDDTRTAITTGCSPVIARANMGGSAVTDVRFEWDSY